VCIPEMYCTSIPQGVTMSTVICALYFLLPAAICAAISLREVILGDVV